MREFIILSWVDFEL